MKVQPVLMLCENFAHHPKLYDDCDKHGWTFRCVTASAISAQRFLRDCRGNDPMVFLIADSDQDIEHWQPLIRQELRPRRITPVVLRTNQTVK